MCRESRTSQEKKKKEAPMPVASKHKDSAQDKSLSDTTYVVVVPDAPVGLPEWKGRKTWLVFLSMMGFSFRIFRSTSSFPLFPQTGAEGRPEIGGTRLWEALLTLLQNKVLKCANAPSKNY